MHISLTPELETLVKIKVDSGRYNNASEVIREALRLWEEHDYCRSRALKAAYRKGFLAQSVIPAVASSV